MARAVAGRGKLWRRPWLWAGVALAVVLLGNSGFRRLVWRYVELRRLRGELGALKAEETRIEERLKDSRRPGPALEGAARRDLGFLKPGEIEYRFPPPAAAGDPHSPSERRHGRAPPREKDKK